MTAKYAVFGRNGPVDLFAADHPFILGVIGTTLMSVLLVGVGAAFFEGRVVTAAAFGAGFGFLCVLIGLGRRRALGRTGRSAAGAAGS